MSGVFDKGAFHFMIPATCKVPLKPQRLPWIKLFLLTLFSICWSGIPAGCIIKEGREKEKGMMVTSRNQYHTGRLTARPANTAAKEKFTAGVQPLNLDGRRDGFIYVPKAYDPDRPAALALMLHGAGGQAEHGLSYLQQYADDNNIILLAPASRAATWDIIVNRRFGTDVIFIDQALALVFERYAVDPARIAIGGFSDGASYALCLGLTNGDLFTHILAFSPGFAHTIEQQGRPAVFISHGLHDQVLPINPCSRRIVPRLQHQGLPVVYHEFDGEHVIPAAISKSGVEWFMANGRQKP
jgi:phospholipase/carboxylesterase